MENRHGDYIWYELMAPDNDAAQKFYGGIFGWTFARSEHPDMDYRLFSAGDLQVGGFMALTPEMQQGGARPLWAGYVAVDDVDKSAKKIAAAGGEVLMEPFDIANVGRIAFAKDPQGAFFYIMRDAGDVVSESFSAYKPRVGHCAWNELITSDPAAAKEFYGEIFGWVVADSMDMGPLGAYEMMKCGAERDFMFGAMMKKPDQMPVSMWNYYFRAPAIDPAVAYVGDNGGSVVSGPQEIPGGDFIINAVDPQGAMFSLIGSRV